MSCATSTCLRSRPRRKPGGVRWRCAVVIRSGSSARGRGIPPARAGGQRNEAQLSRQMEEKMKKFFIAVPIVALTLGGSTACATKKFVRGEVTQVNDKVDTLSKSVEENQERTRTNEGRIGEVDQKAAAAAQSATAAQGRADEAYGAAGKVAERVEAVDKASKRLVYEVVLSE